MVQTVGRREKHIGASNILRVFIMSERAGDCRFSIFAMNPNVCNTTATSRPKWNSQWAYLIRPARACPRAMRNLRVKPFQHLRSSFTEWKIFTLTSVVWRRERKFQQILLIMCLDVFFRRRTFDTLTNVFS